MEMDRWPDVALIVVRVNTSNVATGSLLKFEDDRDAWLDNRLVREFVLELSGPSAYTAIKLTAPNSILRNITVEWLECRWAG